MKRRLISLALAAALTLSVTGCAMTTPSTVGSIGGVEIPAGLYLLIQYNQYSTVAGLAELAEGETSSDVAAVLRAQATGTIGEEEVTATGKDYLAKLVQREMEFYAVVESMFDSLGAELDPGDVATVNANVDALWNSNEALYAANGIGKSSLRAYLLNGYKAQAILDKQYGPDGANPLSDADYEKFLKEKCYRVDSVELPLLDYSTFTFADENQTAEIEALAEACAKELNEAAIPTVTEEMTTGKLSDVAESYLIQAYGALGGSFDAADIGTYVATQLVLPSVVEAYANEDGTNTLTDPLDKANGKWTTINLGTAILIARRVDSTAYASVKELAEQYSLLDLIMGEELADEFYAAGAELPHALNQSAMDTYKAANIRRSV